MIDRSLTKNAIRDQLLMLAALDGKPLSRSRADKLANRYKKGQLDSDDYGIIPLRLGGFDPTGEVASIRATAADPHGKHAEARNKARLALTS